MSVYLLHIEPGLKHARDYIGWTPDATVDRRVSEHLNQVSGKCSPLVRAAFRAGCTVTLARRWEGDEFDRAFERKLKERGGPRRAKRCPLCSAKRNQKGACK
jgi:hypothetical protein